MVAVARELGTQWEAAASAQLESAGLALLAKNFYCRYGEIDLIFLDRGDVAFVEVRFRRGTHGDGTASVGASKRRKLIRTAQCWLSDNPKYAQAPCRFDIVGCTGTLKLPHFEWMRNAFDLFSD